MSSDRDRIAELERQIATALQRNLELQTLNDRARVANEALLGQLEHAEVVVQKAREAAWIWEGEAAMLMKRLHPSALVHH